METKVIVGLAGFPGTGKDELIRLVIEQFDDVDMVAWSDELYRQVAEAYQITEAPLRSRDTKEAPLDFMMPVNCQDMEFRKLLISLGHSLYEPMSPRSVLQYWGTEYRRTQDPNYWTNITIDRIGKNPARVILISGTRFHNEMQVTRDKGGYLLHLTRPGVSAVNAHESEKPLPFMEGDRRLHNDGDLDSLKQKAVEFGLSLGLKLKQDAGQSLKLRAFA